MQLRPYQIEIANAALDRLNRYKIAYLSMQVRTGKTLTALETAKLYGAKFILFVTKKKAISSIQDDCQHYASDFDCIIINYEQLHRFESKVDLVIIDEAHSLGQFPKPAERTQMLKKICEFKPIIYLSGTPSPESYSQIYHQLYVSSYSPFIEPNFYKWAKAGYVSISHKYLYNRAVNDYSNANELLITAKIAHLFLSYTQEEAGFTQLVEEMIENVEMSDKTKNIIRILKRDKVITGRDGHVIEGDTAVKLLNKIHQLCSGTCIYDNSPDMVDGALMDETKANYIFDKFRGKKMAIFHKFRAEKLQLQITAQKNGCRITDSPDEFNNSDASIIFVSQFVSGREGVNLSKADLLICYNIDFSAVTYFQVRARLQTKDRTDPAKVHWLFMNGGIEHDIYEQVSNKKNYTLSYFKKHTK